MNCKRAAFYTLGCKVNSYDTQVMAEKLAAAGYEAVPFGEPCDLCVINTCTVTQVSDKKSRNAVSRARRANPDAVIVVCGCFCQASPEDAAAIEGADIVLGTKNRADIVCYISEFLKTGRKIVDVTSGGGISGERITGFSDKTRAIIKIEDGCRSFCSYCLIPFARGEIESKPVLRVAAEAAAVAQSGYREAVLTGIHLSSYGKDLKNASLIDAIRAAADAEGIEWLRLGSLEPTVITPEFVSAAAGIKKLCPQFHLSLQSGCDKTLRDMNRKYTAARYESAVELLREHFEACAITTDVIVGFPGETDEDFARSLEFIKKIGFAKIHIFPFSPRRGTKAATMPNPVPEQTKRDREHELEKAARQSRDDFMRAFVGKTVSVLAERCEGGLCRGFTEHYLPARFCGGAQDCGKIIKLSVTGAEDDFLVCEKINL